MSLSVENFSDQFSTTQIGYIVDIVEPVNIIGSLDMVKKEFSENSNLHCMAVENEYGVVGLIERNRVLEHSTKGLGGLLHNNIEELTIESTTFYDSRDNIEQVLNKIYSNINNSEIQNFLVYHDGSFLGTLNTQVLVKQVLQVRNEEMLRAKRIQEFLMGDKVLEQSSFKANVLLDMAHELGGDFAQLLKINPYTSMISIYDVSGKNLSASLCTSLISGYFDTLIGDEHRTNKTCFDWVQELNGLICSRTPEDMFVTALFLFVDESKKTIEVINAGYSKLFHLQKKPEGKNIVKVLMPQYPPLGLNKDIQWNTELQNFKIENGSSFFSFSDGLTDARNPDGKQYGEQGVKDFISRNFSKKGSVFLETLMDEFTRFVLDAPRTDDLTALFLECK